MTQQEEPVQVTAADREAAASLTGDEAMAYGMADLSDAVQAFAHHRLASLSPDLSVEVERLRAALKDVIDPIGRLQRDCPAGHELNHSAVTIGNTLQYVQKIARVALNPLPACVKHPERPVREVLDGEPLCQECCDDWARGQALQPKETGL